jgi:hypothetical protein
MEAAAEERAVVLAAELARDKVGGEKLQAGEARRDAGGRSATHDGEHLARTAAEIHEETDQELFESEQAAAVDAHDASDPGVEAAAEERAVMLAAEMAHEIKEKAEKQRSKKKE